MDCSDLNPDELNTIFDGLTARTAMESSSLEHSTEYPEEFSEYPEESIVADTPVKVTSRFVKNSGLVPYDSSFEKSEGDDSCIEIDSDSDCVSNPLSPVFKIPPAVPRDVVSKPVKSSAKKVKPSHFKKPLTKAELEFLSGKTFAQSTDRKISWAANLFRIWRQKRTDDGTGEGEISWCDLDDPGLDPEVLSHVLLTFINEIKCVDGEDYPPNTVYLIIVMLQLFFEKKGKTWKLLDGKDFNNLRNTIDNLIKRRSMERIAQKVKRSELITMTDEEEMWDFGVLSEENPDALRNTVMYLIGLTFALRGGKEHRALRNPHFNPQIQVKVSEKSGQKYLLYTEDIVSKTNQGGLSGRKISPKVVKAFGNPNLKEIWSDFTKNM